MLTRFQPRLLCSGWLQCAAFNSVQAQSQKALLNQTNKWKLVHSVRSNSGSAPDDVGNQRKPANVGIKSLIIEEIGESKEEPSDIQLHEDSWSSITSVKYEQFDASGSRIIHDISEEELGLIEPQEPQPKDQSKPDTMQTVNLERGKKGVYDIEDLVEVLNLENAVDPVVIEIPHELRFVEQMVVVSASSQRHLNSIAMTIRKVYNKKMTKSDRGLVLEGRDSPWVAMDLGNIALHIMSPRERKRVDIETLWIHGAEYDSKVREDAEPAPVDDIFSLAEPLHKDYIDEKPYDISQEYDHPFKPISENQMLPDFEEINDTNRQDYSATSILEMALRTHNGPLSKKFRGRFKK